MKMIELFALIEKMKHKYFANARYSTLQKIGKSPIPSYPGEILHIDIYNTDKQYFLTCIDKFSKFAVVSAIASRSIVDIKVSLINVLNLFHNTTTVVRDNEKAFCSETIKTLLMNQFGVKLFTIPPAHSVSNGQVERFHSTLTEIARCIKLGNEMLNTKELLAVATVKYNISIHSGTKKKPVEVINGVSLAEQKEIEKRIEKSSAAGIEFPQC